MTQPELKITYKSFESIDDKNVAYIGSQIRNRSVQEILAEAGSTELQTSETENQSQYIYQDL